MTDARAAHPVAEADSLTGYRVRSWLAVAVLLFAAGLLPGCQGNAPRRTAAVVPDLPVRYTLSTLPFSEYWYGIRLSGKPAGYGHYRIQRDAPYYLIQSQSVLQLRLMGKDKRITLRSQDRVSEDLQLREFDYSYNMDDSQQQVYGHIKSSRLYSKVINAAGVHEQVTDLSAPLYPSSGSLLYPLLRGLEPGAMYRYWIYDGESQRLESIEQQVVFAGSRPPLAEAVYRVESQIQGNSIVAWMGADGTPLLEEASNGALEAFLLDNEQQALEYLALARQNTEETLLSFSRVRTAPAIVQPRQVIALEVEFSGMGDFRLPAPSQRQQCRREAQTGRVHCALALQEGAGPSGLSPFPPDGAQPFLEHSPIIPSRHPELAALSSRLTDGLSSPQDRMQALVNWIDANIQDEASDVYTAMDVLKNRRAECQGQSFLYAALARAAGIPTRVVNGLVYSAAAPLDGFLYHTWAQSWDGRRWYSIDPTFGQLPADATHIRLVDGESSSDVAPLAQIMGQIEARVVSQRIP